MSDTGRPHITILHSLDDVPIFMCEVEEAAFWETHELGDEILSQMDDLPESILPRSRTKPIPIRFDEDTVRR